MTRPLGSPPDPETAAPRAGETPLGWMADLPAERRERILDHAAEWTVRKGLEAPAVMFLEMHRPLSTMASVGYALVQPPLMLFFGFRRTEELRLVLSDPTCVQALIDRIEERSRGRSSDPGPEGGRR